MEALQNEEVLNGFLFGLVAGIALAIAGIALLKAFDKFIWKPFCNQNEELTYKPDSK